MTAMMNLPLLRRLGGNKKQSLPPLELFASCTRGHRARLVCYDQTGRHQEPYVHMFAIRGANVYRVTCPACGEEYTTFDSDVERSSG